MALPTTTLVGAMLVAGAAMDLPLAAEKGTASNVVEVEGHRDFRQHLPESRWASACRWRCGRTSTSSRSRWSRWRPWTTHS